MLPHVVPSALETVKHHNLPILYFLIQILGVEFSFLGANRPNDLNQTQSR